MRLVYPKQPTRNLKFSKVNFIILITAGFFLTIFGIKVFLNWSKKNQILDIPNERSSHQKPTPVGGGIVFVSVSLFLFLFYLLITGKEIPWSYFGGAVLIAAVSWLDDLYSIPVAVRFFFHSLAALLVIFGLGIVDNIYLPAIGNFQIGNFVYGLWFLWIVWLINAYNFMDGIDGIAAVQAVSAGLGWAFLGYLQGIGEVFFFGLLIAVSCAGFLFYNWQPAKIFMGDVGSAFLGFTFAVFPLFLAGKPVRRCRHIFNCQRFIRLVFRFRYDADVFRPAYKRRGGLESTSQSSVSEARHQRIFASICHGRLRDAFSVNYDFDDCAIVFRTFKRSISLFYRRTGFDMSFDIHVL